MLPRIHRLADSRPLSKDWICDEFCIEIRRESNPRGCKFRSHTISDLNHSANRVNTIGTECSHHLWWEHSVPIVYTRLAEWLRSETVWDRSLCPRGFDSLRISLQNSSFYSLCITRVSMYHGGWVESLQRKQQQQQQHGILETHLVWNSSKKYVFLKNSRPKRLLVLALSIRDQDMNV